MYKCTRAPYMISAAKASYILKTREQFGTNERLDGALLDLEEGIVSEAMRGGHEGHLDLIRHGISDEEDILYLKQLLKDFGYTIEYKKVSYNNGALQFEYIKVWWER